MDHIIFGGKETTFLLPNEERNNSVSQNIQGCHICTENMRCFLWYFWASILCEASYLVCLKNSTAQEPKKIKKAATSEKLPVPFQLVDLGSHRMSQKPGRLWGEHCEVEKSGWHFWHCPKKREKLHYYYLGSIKFEIINWQMFPSSPRTIGKVPLSQSALPGGKLLAWCGLRT